MKDHQYTLVMCGGELICTDKEPTFRERCVANLILQRFAGHDPKAPVFVREKDRFAFRNGDILNTADAAKRVNDHINVSHEGKFTDDIWDDNT